MFDIMASSPLSAQLVRIHTFQSSLSQVQLRWFVKSDVGGQLLSVQISIVDHSGNEHKEWVCQRAARENVDDFYDIPSQILRPGHKLEFNFKLMLRDQNDSDGLMQVLATKTKSFRLGYTLKEMLQLQAKAVEFIRKNAVWIQCELFYRDKDKEYYDECQLCGFLQPTLKNENGDPASPINGCIEGIFLGVSVDWRTEKLPEDSPYGHVRFHIPIERLYGNYFNLYFADFYCHTKSHHLTLVLTRTDSDADKFCKSRIPKLDKMNNPFLYRDQVTGWMHTTASWIHVFYTERIPLNCGWFNNVKCSRPSTNMVMGKPKNPSCNICN